MKDNLKPLGRVAGHMCKYDIDYAVQELGPNDYIVACKVVGNEGPWHPWDVEQTRHWSEDTEAMYEFVERVTRLNSQVWWSEEYRSFYEQVKEGLIRRRQQDMEYELSLANARREAIRRSKENG